VYSLGGGRANSCSILEAFSLVERVTGKAHRWTYVAEHRIGDHICYYSDLRKMRAHYPSWRVTIGLEQTIREIAESWQRKLTS
jgi:CDP-paratose 2-epimerase